MMRMRRIYPALAVLTIASVFVGWFVTLPAEYLRHLLQALSALTLLSNFAFKSDSGYFAMAAQTKPLLHTWSLSLEWQFYFFMPLIVGLVWRLALRAMSGIDAVSLRCRSSPPCHWRGVCGQASKMRRDRPSSRCRREPGSRWLADRSLPQRSGADPKELPILPGCNRRSLLSQAGCWSPAVSSIPCPKRDGQVCSRCCRSWARPSSLPRDRGAAKAACWDVSDPAFRRLVLLDLSVALAGLGLCPELAIRARVWRGHHAEDVMVLLRSRSARSPIAMSNSPSEFAATSGRPRRLLAGSGVAFALFAGFVSLAFLNKGFPGRLPEYLLPAELARRTNTPRDECFRNANSTKKATETYCSFGSEQGPQQAFRDPVGRFVCQPVSRPDFAGGARQRIHGLIATQNGCRAFIDDAARNAGDQRPCRQFNRSTLDFVLGQVEPRIIVLGSNWTNAAEISALSTACFPRARPSSSSCRYWTSASTCRSGGSKTRSAQVRPSRNGRSRPARAYDERHPERDRARPRSVSG